MQRFKELDWLRRGNAMGRQINRALAITPEGRRGFEELFSIDTAGLMAPPQLERRGA